MYQCWARHARCLPCEQPNDFCRLPGNSFPSHDCANLFVYCSFLHLFRAAPGSYSQLQPLRSLRYHNKMALNALVLALLGLTLASIRNASCAATPTDAGPTLTVQFTARYPSQIPPMSTVYGGIMTSFLNVSYYVQTKFGLGS